jgi:hypothetical protein
LNSEKLSGPSVIDLSAPALPTDENRRAKKSVRTGLFATDDLFRRRSAMRYTTKAACQLLGRDRKQQADDIATGHCGHVPPAVDGLRFWRGDDLAAERYFMELRAGGHSVKLAGQIATRLRRAMDDYPRASQLALVSHENGNRFAAPADTLDLSSGYHSGGNIREALTVDARNLRARVVRLIECREAIVGISDE